MTDPAENVSPAAAVAAGTSSDAEGDDSTLDVEYKPPPMKTIDELAKIGEEDESLRKWKESLGLYQGASCKSDSDPRKLVPLCLVIQVPGRKDIEIKISTPEEMNEAKTSVNRIKEGSEFTLMLRARIQNDNVYCLRYKQTVKRTMFRDSLDVMVGSFRPKPEPYEWVLGKENAPTGKLFRGTYNVLSKIFTEENQKEPLLQFEWNMKVCSDWDTEDKE